MILDVVTSSPAVLPPPALLGDSCYITNSLATDTTLK